MFCLSKAEKLTLAIAAKKGKEAEKHEREKELKRSTDRMLSKPCPFRDWENCSDKCAHFNAGHVWQFMDGFVVTGSTCKLWK